VLIPAHPNFGRLHHSEPAWTLAIMETTPHGRVGRVGPGFLRPYLRRCDRRALDEHSESLTRLSWTLEIGTWTLATAINQRTKTYGVIPWTPASNLVQSTNIFSSSFDHKSPSGLPARSLRKVGRCEGSVTPGR
jgi:hypothetical protein